jgi:hypothetical protein
MGSNKVAERRGIRVNEASKAERIRIGRAAAVRRRAVVVPVAEAAAALAGVALLVVAGAALEEAAEGVDRLPGIAAPDGVLYNDAANTVNQEANYVSGMDERSNGTGNGGSYMIDSMVMRPVRARSARKSHRISVVFCLPILALPWMSGCANHRQVAFASPEEASQALVAALRPKNPDRLREVLGRRIDDLISSGDEVADEQQRERLLKAYDEKHAVVREPDGRATLQIGNGDWPMPIPIVERRNGWQFDTKAGQDEILNRRIGRNELSTIQVCLAIADAQREYAGLDRDGDGLLEYAEKVLSDPGQKNGLYWPTDESEPPSPLGPLVAEAQEEGYAKARSEAGKPNPYHGYHFRLLRAQGPHAPGGEQKYVVRGNMIGGFGVVAYPAEYGNSGVKTFIVNQDGVVYERDLGRGTARKAKAMTEFDPGPGWVKAE